MSKFGGNVALVGSSLITTKLKKEKLFRAFNTGPICAFSTLMCTLCAAVALLLMTGLVLSWKCGKNVCSCDLLGLNSCNSLHV